jgi:DNA end-binding protein Ku
MAPRAMWTGQLRLSLVSFGVRMYAATESASQVSMNQLHRGCNQRVKNQLVCPTHGPISRDEIAKGYEYEKDSYVIIDQADMDSIKLQSSKAIDLVQFVEAGEIDPLYVASPYFIGPDGPVAEDAFRVIREAMKRSNRVGIGKLVQRGRENIVALNVHGKGFLLSTLRYASEVRSAEQVFGDLEDGAVDEEQVKLAMSIMDSKTAAFEPEQFHDLYKDAFFEIVKAKIAGSEPVFVEEEEAPTTFNFMDALRQSVVQAEGGAAEDVEQKPAKKKTAPRKTAKKPAAKSVGKKKKAQKRA